MRSGALRAESGRVAVVAGGARCAVCDGGHVAAVEGHGEDGPILIVPVPALALHAEGEAGFGYISACHGRTQLDGARVVGIEGNGVAQALGVLVQLQGSGLCPAERQAAVIRQEHDVRAFGQRPAEGAPMDGFDKGSIGVVHLVRDACHRGVGGEVES